MDPRLAGALLARCRFGARRPRGLQPVRRRGAVVAGRPAPGRRDPRRRSSPTRSTPTRTSWRSTHGSRCFGDDEWVLRLPSAVAAIALVAAVWWLALPLGGRRAATIAALFCALSPLVLQYGQQARGYVFAMLLVTLAVGSRCGGGSSRPSPSASPRSGSATPSASSSSRSCSGCCWSATTCRSGGASPASAPRSALPRLVPQLRDQLDLHPAGLEGFAHMTSRTS